MTSVVCVPLHIHDFHFLVFNSLYWVECSHVLLRNGYSAMALGVWAGVPWQQCTELCIRIANQMTVCQLILECTHGECTHGEWYACSPLALPPGSSPPDGGSTIIMFA